MSQDRVLVLTNDDGLGEPGLEALMAAVAGLGRPRLIAPDGPFSSCGHAVTTGRPILSRLAGEGRVAVRGTPADCVRLALHHLEPSPAWVLSGINAGGNLGVDLYHSGTAAAAREAAIHGVPAVAISHYLARGRPVDWGLAARRASRVLRMLMDRPWAPGTFWNVNLPHPAPEDREPRALWCAIDPSPLPLSFRIEEKGGAEAGESEAIYDGNYHARPRREGSDVSVCLGGDIAVSLVPVAFTAFEGNWGGLADIAPGPQ
jgi:5'-nucleotidase